MRPGCSRELLNFLPPKKQENTVKCYIYRNIECSENAFATRAIDEYNKANGFKPEPVIFDDANTKVFWNDRMLGSLINSIEPGGNLVVYDGTILACSISQILEIMTLATRRKVHIHFVKNRMKFIADSDYVDTQYFINLIKSIDHDFISKRTTFALARRKAAGLPLGRPKGMGNKSLKLDKFSDEIRKYLDLGISKASIAKLVGCHPQTLYDWLDRNGLYSENETDVLENVA
jgi:DNA invertase Pin-like site-specific DNA recombinase